MAGASGGGATRHRRQESMYTMTGLYSETTDTDDGNNEETASTSHSGLCYDSVVKCHSRNHSATFIDKYVNLHFTVPVIESFIINVKFIIPLTLFLSFVYLPAWIH